MAISNIEAWCSARSATMVFWAEGTNFGNLRTWTDGDELTASNYWPDESGNGNDASPLNDTSTNRPIYRDGSTTEIGLNGKPAIEFTGDAADSEGVSTGTIADVSAMPYTLLCVHRARHYSTVRPIHDGVDPDQAAFGWPKTEGADIAHFDVGTGPPSPEEDITSTPIIGPIAECITYDSSITAHFNGSQMATLRTDMPYLGTGGSNNNTGLVLGSKNESGGQSTMDGWIAFAALLPGAISASDRQEFFDWATRYGCVDASGGPQERWEYHKAGEISGSGVLSYTYAPIQGDVLICKLSTSVPTTTATEADHEVRDTNSSGAMWTQAEGLNHVDGVGSASIWYKQAGWKSGTDVWISNVGINGSGNTSAEIQAVSGLTGNVLQTNSDSVTGTATTETVVLTSNATTGSWLSALVFHDADPGTVTNITGGWGGHVDEVRRITADKVATAPDTQSGTFTWTNADQTGFVVVEFEAEPTGWAFGSWPGSPRYKLSPGPSRAVTPAWTEKNVVWSNTAAVDGKTLIFEQSAGVAEITLTGSILTADHLSQLETWAATRTPWKLTDDLGREWMVVCKSFTPQRAHKASAAYYHTYTMVLTITEFL